MDKYDKRFLLFFGSLILIISLADLFNKYRSIKELDKRIQELEKLSNELKEEIK